MLWPLISVHLVFSCLFLLRRLCKERNICRCDEEKRTDNKEDLPCIKFFQSHKHVTERGRERETLVDL